MKKAYCIRYKLQEKAEIFKALLFEKERESEMSALKTRREGRSETDFVISLIMAMEISYLKTYIKRWSKK